METATADAMALLASCMDWHEQLTTGLFLIPWLVSIVLWVIGQLYGVMLFSMYGMFLFAVHQLALAFNGAADQVYVDPFCRLNTYLGGVSHTAFYVSSVATFYVAHYIRASQWPRKMTSCLVALVFFAPPLTLMWFGVRSPTSVALSSLLGIVSTGLFFAMVTTFIDEPQYLARNAVVEYFHFDNGDFLMSPEQVEELRFEREVDAKVLRELQALDKLVATGVLSSFYPSPTPGNLRASAAVAASIDDMLPDWVRTGPARY